METFDKSKPATINSLLVLFAADVDIFLLKEADQVTDKEKTYTKEDIREQLSKTLIKMSQLPLDLDVKLKYKPTFTNYRL